jgi:adenylate cyclase
MEDALEPEPGNPPFVSIAVLPFSNLSGEKENEYFSDGLVDAIITLLTQQPLLRVAARTSSFAFRHVEEDVGRIGSCLHAQELLEGSVSHLGDRVRVCAQLVDSTSGYHRWSAIYDRKVTDLFALQDEIARAIAEAVAGALF